MSNADAFAVLKQKLHAALDPQPLELYVGNGYATPNAGACVDNLAQILWAFFQANGRMPTKIFNDGLPLSAESTLRAEAPIFGQFPNRFNQVITYRKTTSFVGTQIETGQDSWITNVLPEFNCKVLLNGKTWVGYKDSYQTINGQIDAYSDKPMQKQWLNTRSLAYENKIPLDLIECGAFQTWGILLVAYSAPQFLFATDEGIMLTRDGVHMLEKTCAYFSDAITNGGFTVNVLSVETLEGAGPICVGIPKPIADKIFQMHQQTLKAESGAAMFMELVGFAMMALGLYFGVSALSGLIAGQFTIANLSGTLSLAQKFGVDTGELQTGLKIVGLTSGGSLVNTGVTSGGSAVDDFWSGDIQMPDWGNDPFAQVDMTIFNDAGAVNLDLSNSDFYNLVGVTFEGSDFYASDAVWPGATPGIVATPQNELSVAEFNAAVGAMNQAPEYDAIGIGAANEAAVAAANGPMSPTQYAAAAGAAPTVASAAQVAAKVAGANPSNTSMTPAAAKQAAGVALQNAANSPTSAEASIWATASKALTLYGQYQQIAMRSSLPTSVQMPMTAGQTVRQPDGSISIMNPDGTITTVRPNGQPVQTAAGSLPAFVAQNKTLLIAGAVGVAALLLLMPARQ